ncbi:MAG TPA: toluene-4-monooxygenase system B family protein [Polyangiaceae bacterium]|nr:toluene-4-monooxygenase system B family protein [Polyangiaceae bacterium]
MALVPVYGFVRGDTLGVVVLAHDGDTVAQLGRALLDAVAVRIAPAPHLRVYRGELELAPEQTLMQAGVKALDRIDLVLEQTP